jgi:large subunit ribosomal protein L5
MESRLRTKYQKEVVPALMQEFQYSSVMQVPRLEKIVVNIGLGEAIQNPKVLEAAAGDLALITGQKPVITRAKKSIAAFKLRQGMAIGAMVTLRGRRMWEFADRLMNLALPRIRDFRGLSRRSFDGRGNYSIGLREQIIFPEIDYDKVDKLRGMEVAIVTTAPDDAQGYALLKRLGMPFRD